MFWGRWPAKKHIEIRQHLSDPIKLVSLDKGKFRQILYNLLSNAVKFTPEKGTVVIETRADGIDAFVLSVSDSGIGIAEADIKKLFVPFVQIDSGVSRRYEGTGLGLALTKNIVTLHGGEIHVKSDVGKGATFSVRLPLAYVKK